MPYAVSFMPHHLGFYGSFLCTLELVGCCFLIAKMTWKYVVKIGIGFACAPISWQGLRGVEDVAGGDILLN